MSPREKFASNLRRIRAKRDLSLEEVARLTEMDWTEISLLERGKREPRLGTVIKLSAVLEAPLRDFFEGIEGAPLVPTPVGSAGRVLVTSAREGGD